MAENQILTQANSSELLGPINFREAVPRFQSAWNKTRDALFGLLELIVEYKHRPKFDALCEELERKEVIKRSVMSMLIKISQNATLMSPEHREQLPTSYNTLWVLTALDENTLTKKIAKNEINANLTLEDARALKGSTAKSKATQTKAKPELIASIRMAKTTVRRNKDAINRHLAAIEKLGAIVTYGDALAE